MTSTRRAAKSPIQTDRPPDGNRPLFLLLLPRIWPQSRMVGRMGSRRRVTDLPLPPVSDLLPNWVNGPPIMAAPGMLSTPHIVPQPIPHSRSISRSVCARSCTIPRGLLVVSLPGRRNSDRMRPMSRSQRGTERISIAMLLVPGSTSCRRWLWPDAYPGPWGHYAFMSVAPGCGARLANASLAQWPLPGSVVGSPVHTPRAFDLGPFSSCSNLRIISSTLSLSSFPPYLFARFNR